MRHGKPQTKNDDRLINNDTSIQKDKKGGVPILMPNPKAKKKTMTLDRAELKVLKTERLVVDKYKS